MIGITFDSIENLERSVESIVEANLPYRLCVRLVCDPPLPPSFYRDAVALLEPVCDLVILPVDSSEMSHMSVTDHTRRMDEYMSFFKSRTAVRYFEVGNEINGDWCGSDVMTKVNKSLHIAATWGVKTLLTYYMVGNDSVMTSRPEFWLKHYALSLPPEIITLSCYPNQEEFSDGEMLNFFTNAQRYYPGSQLGIGEWGCEGIEAREGDIAREIKRAYSWGSSLLIETWLSRWCDGVFWWDGCRDLDLVLSHIKGVENDIS